MLAGIAARRCGRSERTRSTVSMMLAPGWRNRISVTAGLPVAGAALGRACTEADTWAILPRRPAAPVWLTPLRGVYLPPALALAVGWVCQRRAPRSSGP